jgi:hypothetical protein
MSTAQPPRALRVFDASRTWRSAKQSAVRDYGEGSRADRAALVAVKHFLKRLGKRGIGRDPSP